MNILEFSRSLLPDFTRARILEDIEITRRELNEATLPPYRTAEDLFGKKKLLSTYSQTFESVFDRDVKINHKGNFIVGIYETLENMVENIDMVERLVHRRFASDVIKDAMTIFKLNLLQYVEMMSFVVKYARRLLIVVLTAEVNAANKENEMDGILDSEIQYLAAGRDSFNRGIRVMSDKKKTVEDRFDSIPEIGANDDAIQMANATAEPLDLDPFAFGLIPLGLNPIYHIRLAISEWQAKRYRTAEEESRMLEFRLLQLQEIARGNKDAALQQQIEYNQNRLNKLRYSLKEMEEDARP